MAATPRSSLSKQSNRTGNTAGTKKSVRFADEDDRPSAVSSVLSTPVPPNITEKATKLSLSNNNHQTEVSNNKSPRSPRFSLAPSSTSTITTTATNNNNNNNNNSEQGSDDDSNNKAGDSPENTPPEIGTKVIPSRCPVEQGILNDCWLLSTALSFWRAPEITNQFAKQVSKFCYLIRLWNIGCEWEAYRVHLSNLPQSGGVTIHHPFADYVRYVEAAFLGYFQGAESLAKAVGDPVESNVWLTGGFAERILFNQSEVADRRIFAIMSDKDLFTTVQQSGEKQRHSATVVQWEKLPFGSGQRYLIIDSNLDSDESGANDSKHPSYSIGRHPPTDNRNNAVLSSFGSRTSLLSAAAITHSTVTSSSTPSSRRVTTKPGAPATGSSNNGNITPISTGNGDSTRNNNNNSHQQNSTTTTTTTQQQHDDSSRCGVLTGWYTPQRLASTFDSCTVCRPLIHEDAKQVQSRLVQLMSSWIPDVNSGGSRRNLEHFATNPQFIFKLHLVGSGNNNTNNSNNNSSPVNSAWSHIDGQLPWLWVSLCQPFRFDKSNYSHIAFHVYRLPHKEPPTSPLRASFFLHTGELFSSLPYANYSMATRSYSDMSIPQTPATIPRFPSALYRDDVDVAKSSSPLVYLLVVPSTYFPVKARSEFLLRVYSEIGELSLETAWNFDQKTVNVPWSLFNPETIDFAPAPSSNNNNIETRPISNNNNDSNNGSVTTTNNNNNNKKTTIV